MAQSHTLQAFLNEYSSRLTFSSASKILCLEPSTGTTVTNWCKENLSHVDQPTITTADSDNPPSNTAWPYKEASFTHIFATLSPELKTSVKGLKFVHYSLLWKGIAVILPPEGGQVAGESVNLSRLVELGGFEPGKVRAVEIEGSEICFAMKWDMLTA